MTSKKDERPPKKAEGLEPAFNRWRSGQRPVADEHAFTGGYYWFPTPTIDSLIWQVLTCHELGCDADVGHVDLWALVIDRLATALRRDGRLLEQYLKNDYTGLPRGRVTRQKHRFAIFHGNDAPVSDWMPMVLRKFDLNRRLVGVLFDEHEQMLAEDRGRVKEVLGLDLCRGGMKENQ